MSTRQPSLVFQGDKVKQLVWFKNVVFTLKCIKIMMCNIC